MNDTLITQDYIDHFSQTPSMYTSCANDEDTPETTRVLSGWSKLDSNVIHFAVETSQSERFISFAQVGNRVSLVSVTLSNYLTYQYKGEIISVEPPSPEDLEKVQAYIDGFCSLVAYVGIDSDRYRVGFAGRSYTIVSFKVDSVFDQTPRVGAGSLVKSIK